MGESSESWRRRTVANQRRALQEQAKRIDQQLTAGGPIRTLASAVASRASIVRSAWSRTRSTRRTRGGSSAQSFLSRPNSHGAGRASCTGPSLGIRVWSRLAPIHRLAGAHSPVGQRHLAARRLASAPGEGPLAVFADRRLVLAGLNGGRLPQGLVHRQLQAWARRDAPQPGVTTRFVATWRCSGTLTARNGAALTLRRSRSGPVGRPRELTTILGLDVAHVSGCLDTGVV